MSPSVVGIVCIILLVSILVWDVCLVVDEVEDNTISSVLRHWFKKMDWVYYLVGLFLGVLMGHWGPV